MRLLAAALALTVLAGCTGGVPDIVAPDQAGPDIDVDPQAETGAIAGVVVDEAIRPLAGAVVHLSTGPNATTDESGQFSFTDLEPGTYFLTANATGHTTVQTSAQVEAGEVTRLRILSQTEVVVVPYHETLHFTGLIEFSPGAAGSILNIVIDTGLGMENPLCSMCSFQFNTSGLNVATFVTEAVWEDTLPSPEPSSLYLEFFPADLDDGTDDIQGGFLPSPILEHYPIAMWGLNETNIDWHVRLTGDADSVQYNQQYEMYVTLFMDGPAPDGWSLVKGDV
jgi:hypothetical protein